MDKSHTKLDTITKKAVAYSNHSRQKNLHYATSFLTATDKVKHRRARNSAFSSAGLTVIGCGLCLVSKSVLGTGLIAGGLVSCGINGLFMKKYSRK
jgi:hypothetical protein